MPRTIDMRIAGKSINTTLAATVIVAVLFLTVPYASKDLLMTTDNLLVRGLLVAAVIGSLYVDMLLALVVLLLVTRIFIERNNRKLLDAKAVITNNSVRKDIVLPDEVGEIQDIEARVDRQVYSPEEGLPGLDFLPSDDQGDNNFTPLGADSINGKTVLQSTVEGSAAASAVFGDQHPNPEISNNSAP